MPVSKTTQLLTIAALIVSLAACQLGPPPRDAIDTAKQRAAELAAEGDLRGAAELYWAQAANVDSPERESLRLRAVEVVLTPLTADAAREYLAEIDETNVEGELLVRKRIAQARLALLDDQPRLALRALPETIARMAPKLAPRARLVRARALGQTGRMRAAVATHLEIDSQLDDAEHVAANRDALWEALMRVRPRELTEWARATQTDTARGWLELAHIASTSPRDLVILERRLLDWREGFAGHPAAARFPERVRAHWQALRLRPQRIGVLLPMSGPYAAVSQAVLAGLTSAFYSAGADGYKPSLRVYDTADAPHRVNEHYDRAVAEGAEMVVGPIDKEAVRLLAQRDALPVPVLTLNYTLDSQVKPPPGLFQFGLLPEDEARQAAERGILEGHRGALLFAPQGEWGTRLATAFRARFERLGGRVLDVARYDPSGADFSTLIERALKLDESAARHQALEDRLARELKFSPYRRRDADMVFLAASPQQARLIRPQFRFHYAADLPLYATSHVFSGAPDARSDRDIDGLIYSEIPWMLGAVNPRPQLRASVERLFPQSSQRLPRLVALGFDALRIIPRLRRLAARPYERYTGLTGEISVDAARRLHRELRWARFVDGQPQALTRVAVAEEPSARAGP